MDNRYRKLLKTLIEKYIVEGQPIGSKSLAESSKLDISAATVRNVMAELEDMGMVVSPHISAGRIPTVRGFRFFIDTLLTIKSIKNHEVKLMKDALSDDTPKDIINQAANLLSNMSKFAGVVSTSRKNNSFRQLEFLKLADNFCDT
jgi:heat-inducible transcriptional repressor